MKPSNSEKIDGQPVFNPRELLADYPIRLLLSKNIDSKDVILQNVIGDSYLYKHFTVFRNIRNHFLAAGGSFTKKDQIYYRAAPFASLPKIVQKLQVPVFENIPALRAIEGQYPRKIMVSDIVNPRLHFQKNYLLHETSHCVFEINVPTLKKKNSRRNREYHILRSLMGEAFANTTAALCMIDVKTKTDLAFYSLNDYGYGLAPIRVDLIKSLSWEVGDRTTFKILYFSHLILKFLAYEISRKEATKILLKLIPELSANQQQLVRITTLVNSILDGHDFIIDLNSFYFRLSGFKQPLDQIIGFDFIQTIFDNPQLLKSFEVLANISVTDERAQI